MADELYNVVFTGELVRSFELAVVKKNLAQLFKMDPAKVEGLFSGKPVTLKKNINFEAANKYRVAIKKAGARVDLVEVKQEAEKPAPRPSQGKAVFGERPSTAQPPLPVVEDTPASPPPISQEPAPSEGGFSLAPVGADVLAEDEKANVPDVEVDTSALSVKEMQGPLVDSNELPHEAPVQVNVDGIDLAPEGGMLLKDEERKDMTPREVDTSGLSLDELGAQLGSPKPAAPPAPDVSNIRLAD